MFIAGLALLVWAILFWVFAGRPAVAPAETRGLYAREGIQQPFYWTSSQVVLPVHGRDGPTTLVLELAAGLWPNRAPPQVTILDRDTPLVGFTPAVEFRRYSLLLPPTTRSVLLETTVDRPSDDDRRWLGVQLRSIEAIGSGLPSRAAVLALLGALISIPAVLLFYWCMQRGYAGIAVIATIGLVLRAIQLDRLPAGFFQDEVVSLLDAWSLVHTGRDHLGNFLPLGAFESFGDWVSPLIIYLEVPVVMVLGTTPLAGRVVTAIVGTLTIVILYAITRLLQMPLAASLVVALVAAVSPWQILRSRVAAPPALVPLCWALCMLAGLRLIQRGGRREATWFALAAGLGLYAYPIMKLAVPLLVACVVLLVFIQELQNQAPLPAEQQPFGVIRSLFERWWPAGVVLAILWLPFAHLTLLNDVSGMRAAQKVLRADTAVEWLAQWVSNYAVYFGPQFYFISGDASNGIPDQGVALLVEAPLIVLGLFTLLWRCIKDSRAIQNTKRPGYIWWFVLAALLIAPLPASLMTPNPHLSRAIIIAPMYALLVGLGITALWQAAQRLPLPIRAFLPQIGAVLVIAAIGWQGIARFEDYRQHYPRVVMRKYQDGLHEAVGQAVHYAPQFDEIWIDDRMSFGYVYILASQAMAPETVHASIEVERPGTTFNTVRRVGQYRFTDVKPLPTDLPVLDATVNSLGEPAFLLQTLEQDGKRILVLRKML